VGYMKNNLIFSSIRLVVFFGAILLVALISNSTREDWGDVIYIITAVFILAGGETIARRIIAGWETIANWRARRM
jgi:general stress protein CsbA